MANKFFNASDGWLFTTLMYFDKRKLSLSDLISVGNTLNHAIFSLQEINEGLSRLESEDFIELKNGRLFLTLKGKNFHKTYRKRFELCIPQQVRYSELFSKMPLEKKEVLKEIFKKSEYDEAIKNI